MLAIPRLLAGLLFVALGGEIARPDPQQPEPPRENPPPLRAQSRGLVMPPRPRR